MEPLTKWLSDRIQLGDVPRMHDVIKEAKQQWPKLTLKTIKETMRIHPSYLQVLHQQRERLRSRKYRPIVAQTLGYLHGDIAFFSVNSHYETPITFRSGILVFCDVVSRYVYIEILRKNRKAPEIIHALKRVFAKHKEAHSSYPIRAISFDQERSFMSNEVQTFLKDHNIKFTPFRFSSSKSKLAENTIGRIRAVLAVLEHEFNYQKPWWTLLDKVENVLNSRQIVVQGKEIGQFSPASVTQTNVSKFLDLVYKANPAQYFAQFNIDDSQHTYQFSVGTLVKAKLLVTSSAVLGTKRSTERLSQDLFAIEKRFLYVKKNLTLGELYACRNLSSQINEHFDSHDIVRVEQQTSKENG